MPNSTTTKTGLVKWYSETKGFGFIIQDGGGPDYFFHISQVNDACEDPVKGSRVTFEESKDRDGRVCAQNVLVTPSSAVPTTP